MGPVIGCDGPRGTVWPSNGGYCVLGQLIADVTGMPYAQAATRLVLDPLGMRDSRFPARAADIPGAAVTGYTVTPDGAFEPFPAQVYTIQAVAGLWSTGADLVRLGTGWPSLLPPALAREAVTPQAVAPRRARVAPRSGSASDCSWTAGPPPAADPASSPSPCCAAGSATTAPSSY